jgi:multiple sugar transport system substrate-binding protein
MRARTFLLLLLSLVFVAAACGGGGGSDNKGNGGDKNLTFWVAEDNAERVKVMQGIVNRFQQKSGITVKLSAIYEDQLQSQVTSASAAGSLPDVFGALSLGFVHSLAADDITDPDAANEVIDSLGRDTFVKRAVELASVDGKAVAVPSDTWTQLLVYRKDLFQKAGLEAPDTFDKIQTAAAKLNGNGMTGIAAATIPNDSFTQQTFEYFALADNCQLTDQGGTVTLTSQPCVNTFKFYTDLIKSSSARGAQDVDTTRASYFAGKSAMLVWSSFILDELAGLRNDALPTCKECKGDKEFLAKNSGIVTAIKGPDGSQPSQFGEVTSFAITKDGNVDGAKQFIEYMLNDAYLEWLGFAPEGKFPTRKGTKDEPDKFSKGWEKLPAGVDAKKPLSEIYPPDVLNVLKTSTDTMNRWGFPQGQGRLVGAQLGELPIPKALADVLDGKLDAAGAAKQAQADVEEIAQSVK